MEKLYYEGGSIKEWREVNQERRNCKHNIVKDCAICGTTYCEQCHQVVWWGNMSNCFILPFNDLDEKEVNCKCPCDPNADNEQWYWLNPWRMLEYLMGSKK